MTDKYNFLQSPSFSLSGQLNALNGQSPEGFDPMWGMGQSQQFEGIDPALQNQALRTQIKVGDATAAAQDRLNQPLTGWAKGAQTFGTVAEGLAGLANIYLGYQGMKQQKKAFEFNKNVVNTNLGNSISDYNRRLNDTLQNRALNNGQGSGWVSQQLAQYSAKRAP